MNYKETADFFAENNYVVVKNFINKGLAKFMYDYTILKNKSDHHLINTNYVPDGSFCGSFEDGQVCLGYNNSGAPTGYNWGMFVEKSGDRNKKGKEIFMEPGDMIIYRGCKIEHWREKFKGTNLSQVFLHFNDGEGPYKDYCKYDGRPMLGLPHDYKDPEKMKKRC